MYIRICYVSTQILEEKYFFVACLEKTTKNHMNSYVEASKFYLLRGALKIFFFPKNWIQTYNV
jgi:hypothetical protein